MDMLSFDIALYIDILAKTCIISGIILIPEKTSKLPNKLTQGTISTFISNTGTVLFAEISLYHTVALGST